MKTILLAALLANITSLTTAQRAEIKKVEEKLLAPCCYSQSIARHPSDIAEQMRAEVAEMVAEGKGETEILNHYRALYGERIIAVPDGKTGQLLFALPVGAFLSGIVVLIFFMRKMLAHRPAPSKTLTSPTPLRDSLREEIERHMGDIF
jgi:cytochrome c-type biogenesis protein CcmH